MKYHFMVDNIRPNLNCFSLKERELFFEDLGLHFDEKEIEYYDTVLYSRLRGELLIDNIPYIQNIDPYIVSVLTHSKQRVRYSNYDSRLMAHRILLSTYVQGQFSAFGYLLICNNADYIKSANDFLRNNHYEL